MYSIYTELYSANKLRKWGVNAETVGAIWTHLQVCAENLQHFKCKLTYHHLHILLKASAVCSGTVDLTRM